jgi:hypothetical protein
VLTANCPNCGAEIVFRTIGLPVKVCDFCHSTVVRSGDTLTIAGQAAEVPDDVSPLQIGTRGKDGGQSFELIGRVRWRWTDGAWSEWLMLFDDGTTGWLGEAMGRYMLLREAPLEPASAAAKTLAEGGQPAIGTLEQIGGTQYTISDVKRVSCIASEGELPYRAPAGLEAVSVDLMRDDGGCASIQLESGTDAPEAYAGRYVTLADIAATNLRAFEGWAMPKFAA